MGAYNHASNPTEGVGDRFRNMCAARWGPPTSLSNLPDGLRIVLTDPANLVTLHRRWLVFVILTLAGAGGWCVYVAQSAPRWPGGGSTSGLLLGIIAAALIVFEAAIWLRKTHRFRTMRILGSAQLWMKAHLWLGLLVAPLALMHSGFSFGGPFTAVLMWVLLLVIASGVFGLIVQNVIPGWMLERVPNETVFSQIDCVQQQYAEQGARAVYWSCGESRAEPIESLESARPAGTVGDPATTWIVVGARRQVGTNLTRTPEGISPSQTVTDPSFLLQAYDQVIRPFLEGSRATGHHLASRRRCSEYFAVLRQSAGADAEPVLDTLEQLCEKVHDLRQQRRLHYVLHGWLAVHLPLSMALLVLLGAHIFFALRYG